MDYLARGTPHRHLRSQKKRRKRYGKYDRRGQIPARTSIEERPEVGDRRERLGDWEVDTVIGKASRRLGDSDGKDISFFLAPQRGLHKRQTGGPGCDRLAFLG